ncbi:PspC domain-containing protein [Oscillochloris sp. ZM17-4]|uniref:PspC domain-containing protein n=1 Tax=Oscillochloris sp. ZM17-4 TaxID=2866714 RepID=UPI001C737807|nr:PspC domain-containing protein [Oscillochloris sp. ZM17-4]MBX0327797.1 PspC domain-containing protein [Oscillochloris sp. ZM17-4]
MQPRLTRSPTESMIAGVCGGLAEYFNIDPVIVRLIFVLVTLTSGLGLPVYVVLWIVMPRANAASGQQSFQQGVQQFGEEASRFGQEFGQEAARLGREVLRQGQSQGGQGQPRPGATGAPTQSPPPPAEYRFDPITGQPLTPERPSTGQTVNLNMPPASLPTAYGQPAPPRRARNWRTLGFILIGIGGLIFLEQIGIDMSLVFPALLIFAGVFLMRRKR